MWLRKMFGQPLTYRQTLSQVFLCGSYPSGPRVSLAGLYRYTHFLWKGSEPNNVINFIKCQKEHLNFFQGHAFYLTFTVLGSSFFECIDWERGVCPVLSYYVITTVRTSKTITITLQTLFLLSSRYF